MLLHTVLLGSRDNSALLLHQPNLVILVFPSSQPGQPPSKPSRHLRPLFKVTLAYPCNSWLGGETHPKQPLTERPEGLLPLLGSTTSVWMEIYEPPPPFSRWKATGDFSLRWREAARWTRERARSDEGRPRVGGGSPLPGLPSVRTPMSFNSNVTSLETPSLTTVYGSPLTSPRPGLSVIVYPDPLGHCLASLSACLLICLLEL